ncbi:MAG: TIGR01440 family protein [Clostridia bacterium]|nr:TIGR01440 family protein [Clostridia bacterium]
MFCEQLELASKELVEKAGPSRGMIVVIGCSTSEVTGNCIGSNSRPDVAERLWETLHRVFSQAGIYIAVQCCEHLNRAIVTERAALPNAEIVNVIPQPKAGGSLASAAYRSLSEPIVVEHIKADAGLDIGNTLIGMHLKEVAVPLRLSVNKIGEASLVAARTRPKFIGGCRAVYDEKLL